MSRYSADNEPYAGFKPVVSHEKKVSHTSSLLSSEVTQKVEEVEEKEGYAYQVQVACSLNFFDKHFQSGFKLAKTEKEGPITSWAKSEVGGYTLLTARAHSDSPRPLYQMVMPGVNSYIGIPDATPTKKELVLPTESFVPVRPAIQLGKRLGWPTEGYLYHFIDETLVHEYIVEGNGSWQMHASYSSGLFIDSEPKYFVGSYILLPWKRKNQIVENQYLFYCSLPLSEPQISQIDKQWLRLNALKLDLQRIVDVRQDKTLEREYEKDGLLYYDLIEGDSLSTVAERYGTSVAELKRMNPSVNGRETQLQIGETLVISETSHQRTIDTLPPASISDTALISNVHYEFHRRDLTNNAATLFENTDPEPIAVVNVATVATTIERDNSEEPSPFELTLNPRLQYWPNFNFLTRQEIKVKYESNNESIAILSLEETSEFIANILIDTNTNIKDFISHHFSSSQLKTTLGEIKDWGGVIHSLNDARDMGIALGGLGVTSYVKNINGKDWIILKGFKKYQKTLLRGHKWGANNPQILKMGLGLAEGKGKLAVFKTTAVLEVTLSVGINIIDYIVRDEATMGDVVGNSFADISKGLLATGIALQVGKVAAGAFMAAFGATSAPVVLVVGSVAIAAFIAGKTINAIDDEYKLTEPMINIIKETIDK